MGECSNFAEREARTFHVWARQLQLQGQLTLRQEISWTPTAPHQSCLDIYLPRKCSYRFRPMFRYIPCSSLNRHSCSFSPQLILDFRCGWHQLQHILQFSQWALRAFKTEVRTTHDTVVRNFDTLPFRDILSAYHGCWQKKENVIRSA